MSSRDIMLATIRHAISRPAPDGLPAVPPPGDLPAYRRRLDATGPEIVDRFLERLRDYNVHVEVLDSEAAVIAAATARLAALGLDRLVIPADLPAAWRPAGVTLVEDQALDHQTLNAIPGTLTGAALAIAETGSIVLDGGRHQGRRALTLLPDYHLCVVFADQLVGLVPEAMDQLGRHPARPITFFSGPSATADIELDRVVGVHGPRTLDVLFVTGPTQPREF